MPGGPKSNSSHLARSQKGRRTIKNRHHERKREQRRRKLLARRVRRNLPATAWGSITDPRGRQGRRYKLSELLQLLVLGMLTGAVTLRDVENLARDIVSARRFGVGGCPSDTTLERVTRKLKPDELRPVLYSQVKSMHRSKQLAVLPSLGLSLVAVDGKALGTDNTHKHPQAQAQHSGGVRRYVLRAMRAVHISSAVKPVLDQIVIPADAGEANTFVPFMEALLSAYGRTGLIDCVTVDAGFTSRSNMHWLDERGIGFIAALKGDQPTLHGEARRILGSEGQQPAEGWELEAEDVTGSRIVTRWFSRSRQMVDFHDWRCIRQVWRVRQCVRQAGKTTWEDRYFLTNLVWGRLGAERCLEAVRAHWGIENDCNWTLDAIWKEDQRCWVRMDSAMETLGLLRLLAYNLIRLLRYRVLQTRKGEVIPYRRLLQLVRIAITVPWNEATVFS